ncbi:MAG: MFS transporter, partial [Desulfobacterales bacterium]
NMTVSQAYISDITKPEHRTRVYGYSSGVFGAGLIFGPFIGGVLSRIDYSLPMFFAATITLVSIVLVVFFLSAALRILNEYERGVVFRLGRVIGPKGPGLIILIPIIDKMTKVSLRLIVLDVDPQDVITRDNVSVKVNAVIYFRVIDPIKAIVEVENYSYAMSQLAQTTIRSVCGQAELDDLLSEREKINTQLQEILDTHTDPWGIKVATVELKHIDLPQEMQRAMARQAEAERERRAKVINAEGEFQAAARLAEASRIIEQHPTALQLRYLQTVNEMSAETNTTTIFPLPLELLTPFIELYKKARTVDEPQPQNTAGATPPQE